MSRDLDKVINRAFATPIGIDDDDMDGQVVEDAASITAYGIRPWSAQNLIIKQGVTESNTALEECRLFAQYFMDEYADPENRISSITFRSSDLNATGSEANWALLSECDINDRVTVTIGSPGGGGLEEVPYYIEGIHETGAPAAGEMDDVTLTLDLSPADYFSDNPFVRSYEPDPAEADPARPRPRWRAAPTRSPASAPSFSAVHMAAYPGHRLGVDREPLVRLADHLTQVTVVGRRRARTCVRCSPVHRLHAT